MKFFNPADEIHKNRIVGLDILRSIAILLVIFDHGGTFFSETDFNNYYVYRLIRLDGVSIFFVLSGFLIGGILFKIISTTGFTTKDLFNFWIRRWFRTIPNYLFVMAFILVFNSILLGNGLKQFSYEYFLFTQNFISPHPQFFPEAWSLTVEEWFYLLFPITYFFLNKFIKNKTNAIITSIGIFIIIPFLYRIIRYELHLGVENLDENFRKVMFIRLDSLMYGIIGAYFHFKNPKVWFKYKIQMLFLGLFLLVLIYYNPLNWKYAYYPFSFNIESIVTLIFLPYLSSFKSTNIKFLDSLFVFLSVISYSMYLLNFTPVLMTLMPITERLLNKTGFNIIWSTPISYCLYLFYTFIFSYILYSLFEEPVTKLRDKISKN